jgi:hypothetical protein
MAEQVDEEARNKRFQNPQNWVRRQAQQSSGRRGYETRYRQPHLAAGLETKAKAIGPRPTGVARPADPNILVANDVKRKVRMATPVGFEAKRQEYEAQYGAGSYPYKSVSDSNTNAFVVYKELNG